MILVSSGEPAGIGPDIILKLVQQANRFSRPWVVLGDRELFASRAKRLNLPIKIRQYAVNQVVPYPNQSNELWVWHVPLRTPVQPGVLSALNAQYVLEMLARGTAACVQGIFDAFVTAPIHKGVINEAGFLFSGHTEYFAHLTDVPEVVMLLASEQLRVALVTTHLPLRDVSNAITPEKLESVINIIHTDFKKYFKNNHPHIYVAGLNPHAGEGGYLGREEIDVISPVLQKMQDEKINVHGPLPADTLFTRPYLEKADVFLAMYHDQGLSVLKYAAFDEAVNITLGLPFIRTSVDHGTALDLAGTDKASAKSLANAMHMAIYMSLRNKITISLIVAASENNVIGKNNQLLWHLPNDLNYFKKHTLNKPVIMGRKTFESIVQSLGKPLPKRQNIVITHESDFHYEGVMRAGSLIEAINAAKSVDSSSSEVMIIGGGSIYAQALPLADQIYLTRVHHTIEGDVFFPELDLTQWLLTDAALHPADEKNSYAHTFMTYRKK